MARGTKNHANVGPGTQALAAAGILGILLFAGIVAAMPLVKAGYDPVRDAISYAAVGELGWLQTVAFVGLSVGSAAVAVALSGRLSGRAGRAGVALVGAWSVCILLAGVFPADLNDAAPTLAGGIHHGVSLAGFAFLISGMWTASFAMRRTLSWAASVGLSRSLAAAATVGLVATAATQAAPFWGLVQRFFVVLLLAWLSWVALRSARGSADADAVSRGNPVGGA